MSLNFAFLFIKCQKGGGPVATNEDNKKLQLDLESHQKELEKAKEDAKHSQEEMERLLQLVQMSQEEHNTKDKTIRDLQE